MAGTHQVSGRRDDDAEYRADRSYLPTSKQRMAVRRAVRELLDRLAPESAPARTRERVVGAAIQRVRSPQGCILQAAGRAVSVSWFAAADTDATLGELQVIVWRGVVSRPGSAERAAGGAEPVWRTVLRPIEGQAGNAWAWRGADDREIDGAALAAHCHGLLGAGPSGADMTGRRPD